MYLIVNVNGRCDGRFRGHCYYIYLHLNLFKNLFYPPSSDLIYSRQNARIIRRRRRTRTAIAPLEVCVASCPLSLCNTRLTRYFLLCICICVCMCAPPPSSTASPQRILQSISTATTAEGRKTTKATCSHSRCILHVLCTCTMAYRVLTDLIVTIFCIFIIFLYYII